MEKMFSRIKENKSFIIPWIVLGISILVFASGLTYAYFDFVIDSSEESSLKVVGTNFELTLSGTEINATNMYPIYDDYKDTQAEVFNFTLSNNSRKVPACYTLALYIDNISEGLKTEDFKWELVNNTTNYQVNGNFKEVSDGRIMLNTNQTIRARTSVSYTLKIWLSNSLTVNQSTTMGGNLSAKIVSTAVGNACLYEEMYMYAYTGTPQTFVAPLSGAYKVELWGAQGGGTSGGHGAYTSGIIELTKGEKIYVYVGESGSIDGIGGWNGGGSGRLLEEEGHKYGGGATDIRLMSGAWNNQLSLNSRIMVAAGGGGNITNDTARYEVGHAGGLEGYRFVDNNFSTYISEGGTQTSGGTVTNFNCTYALATNGIFGKGGIGGGSFHETSSYGSFGGGGGYYGGAGGSRLPSGMWSGGGGSSYISGHAGCIAIASGNNNIEDTRTIKDVCDEFSTSVECSIHYSDKYFTNTVMIDGTGHKWTTSKQGVEAMPSPSVGNYDLNIGNTGNGYARISMQPLTLTVNLDGGTQTVDYSSSNYMPMKEYYIEPPKKENYVFGGWIISGTGTTINNNTLTMGITNTTITARWTTNQSLIVDLDGGTTSQNFNIYYAPGEKITLLNPVRSGYSFSEWIVSGTEALIEENILTMGSEQTTVRASWTPNTYTVNYNCNGGTGTIESSTHTYGVFQNLNANTCTNSATQGLVHNFLGWSTLSSDNNPMYSDTQSVRNITSSGTITLYAVWSIQYIFTADGSFTVPITGKYKVELWGGKAGSYGGNGAYTSGTINLNEGENIYIKVGTGAGTSTGTFVKVGPCGSNTWVTSKSGGSTDMRIGEDSLYARIMIAAGGASGYRLISVNGSCISQPDTYVNGTSAGGILSSSETVNQTTGYSFGVGATSSTGNGGGGYWGGDTREGGTSYISGHTGCVSIAENNSTTARIGTGGGECLSGTTDNLCSLHYSGKKFTETLMIDGDGYTWTNVKAATANTNPMPNPIGGTYASGGNTTNGYALITLIP